MQHSSNVETTQKRSQTAKKTGHHLRRQNVPGNPGNFQGTLLELFSVSWVIVQVVVLTFLTTVSHRRRITSSVFNPTGSHYAVSLLICIKFNFSQFCCITGHTNNALPMVTVAEVAPLGKAYRKSTKTGRLNKLSILHQKQLFYSRNHR